MKSDVFWAFQTKWAPMTVINQKEFANLAVQKHLQKSFYCISIKMINMLLVTALTEQTKKHASS